MFAEVKLFSCPKPGCRFVCKVGMKQGYSNPYSHLKTCYGGEALLLELYRDAVVEQDRAGGQGTLADFLRLLFLRDQRKGMTPQLFEALTFLKVNHRFWNLNLVCQAMKEARTAVAEHRIQAQELMGSNDET